MDGYTSNANLIKTKSKKKKKFIIPMFFVFATLVIVGTSYALWQLTFTQSGTNVITTGCLKLTLTDEADAINLTGATPTSDEDGKKLEPYTFTLTNICTAETNYVVNLETLSSDGKILADNYVRANLNDGSNEVFLDNLLETHVNEEKVISDAIKAYKLYQGKLGSREKISFNLRLWMSEDTEAIDEVMEASWQGKITVTASYVPVGIKNLMKEIDFGELEDWGYAGTLMINKTYTQNALYMENKSIDRIVFQSVLNPYNEAESVVDFSQAQDRSILGYYVSTGETDFRGNSLYTLYIQADGKIKINSKASYFFSGWYLYSIDYDLDNYIFEGLENLDTSLITDMSYMLYLNHSDSLDLTIFDTSKVINMDFMFYECQKLTTTINITNPNVENYSNMFYGAATEEGAQITVNYTAETSDSVDRMIATKSDNSNVVKGTLIS